MTAAPLELLEVEVEVEVELEVEVLPEPEPLELDELPVGLSTGSSSQPTAATKRVATNASANV